MEKRWESNLWVVIIFKNGDQWWISFFLDVVYSHNVTITVVESPSMVRRKVVFMAAPVLLPLRLFGPGLSPADGMTLPASKNRWWERLGWLWLAFGILLENDVIKPFWHRIQVDFQSYVETDGSGWERNSCCFTVRTQVLVILLITCAEISIACAAERSTICLEKLDLPGEKILVVEERDWTQWPANWIWLVVSNIFYFPQYMG